MGDWREVERSGEKWREVERSGEKWCGLEADRLLCLRLARSRSPKPPGFGAGEATRKLIMPYKPTAAPLRQPGLRASPRVRQLSVAVWPLHVPRRPEGSN